MASPMLVPENSTHVTLPRKFCFIATNEPATLQNTLYDSDGKIIIYKTTKLTEIPTVPGGAYALVLIKGEYEYGITSYQVSEPVGTKKESEFICYLDETVSTNILSSTRLAVR